MKEKDKILYIESVLKIFFILLTISFFLRITGYNLFSFDLENPTVIKLTNIIYQGYFGQFLTLYLSSFILFQLICQNKNQNQYYLVTFHITLLNILIQLLINNPNTNYLYTIVNILLLLLGIFGIDRKIPIKKTFLIFLLNIFYQAIALFIRNITYTEHYNIVYEFLLQIDYMILLILTYLIYKQKQLKIAFPKPHFPVNFIEKKNTSEEKSLTKEEKREQLSFRIYLFLSLIWNFFTLGVVIFVCTLNTTLMTTIFLLFSFVTTKSTFGEAFHMKSALSCFIVSNLVYFALSRITVSIHLSFLIPILLGVALSYISSLFVKKKEEPVPPTCSLYRGIPEKELEKICQEKGLNKYELNLLKDFYSNRMSLLQLSMKYNYSKDTIYYHKKKAMEKVKTH